ncbi:MAG: hypothetical protein ACFE75_06415 [Candidatus Hodarchaeota archaeon]
MNTKISAITKYIIAVNKKPNFNNALIDAMRGFKAKIEIGLFNIISKLIFSIISKIPVKKGVKVIKTPIV